MPHLTLHDGHPVIIRDLMRYNNLPQPSSNGWYHLTVSCETEENTVRMELGVLGAVQPDCMLHAMQSRRFSQSPDRVKF